MAPLTFVQTAYQTMFGVHAYQYLVVFIVIVFVAAAAYAYVHYYQPKKAKVQFADVPNYGSDEDKEILITMFHVNWCPYCTTAKPQYEEFKNQYDGQVVNGYRVTIVETDCTEDKDTGLDPDVQHAMDKYDIKSYPTVKALVPDAKTGVPTQVSFDARVTKTNLDRFLESLSQSSAI